MEDKQDEIIQEIIQAAKDAEKKVGFSDIVLKAKGVDSAYGIGFLEGAMWLLGKMMKDAIETTIDGD